MVETIRPETIMSIGTVHFNSAALSHAGSVSTGISPHGVPAEVAADQRNLIQAVKSVSPAELFGDNTELSFVFDRDTRKTLVRVLDRTTGEVLMQIPAERVLQKAHEMSHR